MVVSVLHNRLRLLSIPKTDRAACAHAVIRNILFPRAADTFFSYTENALELSIITDAEVLSDFDLSTHPHQLKRPGWQLSSDVFRSLEIDSNADGSADKRRIEAFTAPLAEAGVSILYLSTYQSDLILVKEKHLNRVISLLSEQFTFSNIHSPSVSFDVSPIPFVPDAEAVDAYTVKETSEREVSEVEIGMVGLSREWRAQWMALVVKLLMYPELAEAEIGETDDEDAHVGLGSRGVRFVSYTAMEDGVSLMANVGMLRRFDDHWVYQSQESASLRVIQLRLDRLGFDRYGIVHALSQQLVNAGIPLLYLSTFRTANVLVESHMVARAQAVLGFESNGDTLINHHVF